MDSLQIFDRLRALLGDRLLGVFSRDQTKDVRLNEGQCYIVNTLDSTESDIGHWVALAKLGGRVLLFDSLALPEVAQMFAHDKRNKQRIQHTKSNSCGEHAMFFLILLFMGYSFDVIINDIYSRDLRDNDLLVTRLFSK